MNKIWKTAFMSTSLIAFMSTSFIFSADSTLQKDKSQIEPQEFVDYHGYMYTLTKNDDGSETIINNNGQSVQFKRDENGNYIYISGKRGLLMDIAE